MSDIFEMVNKIKVNIKKDTVINICGNEKILYLFIMCFLFDYWRLRCELDGTMTLETFNRLKTDVKWIMGRHNYNVDVVKKYRRPMRVLVSGDRDSTTTFTDIITAELKKLPKNSIIIHGGCRGIDLTADAAARKLGLYTESYPITQNEWNTLGRAAGPMRNKIMLDTGIDVTLGFHPNIDKSKGTKDCLKKSRDMGIPTFLFERISGCLFNQEKFI